MAHPLTLDRPLAVPATRRWFVLFMFTLAYAFAYLDRQVLTLLVEPIRAELALSDTQLGLLQGAAFSLFFALGGVPLGWLVDNRNRIGVAAGCIAVWGVATALTGLAASYWQLVVARAGTATAEAGTSPAALSVLADLFPARLIPRATSIYMTAPYIGGGLALVGGSMALQHFTAAGGISLPMVGALAPWRAVFVSVGLPGLLLAALTWLTVREPARSGLGSATDQPVSFGRTLRFVFRDSGFLGFYFAGYAAILVIVFAVLAWYPSLAIREGLGSAASVGRPLGLIFLLSGCLGTLGSQWLVRQGGGDAEVLAKVLRAIHRFLWVQLPIVGLLTFTRSLAPALVLYAGAIACLSVLTALMPVALQVGVPNRMRGRVAGLFLLVVNLVGSSVGPAAVGALSDAWKNDEHGLARAMLVVVVLASGAAIGFIRLALRRQSHPPLEVLR
jgi:MFS family permease